MGEHAGRKVVHDGFGLDMVVAEHFIGAPVTDKMDDVLVDLGTEKCHRASGAERSCRDVFGEEPKLGSQDSSGQLEGGRDVFWGDRMPVGVDVIGGKWGGVTGTMIA